MYPFAEIEQKWKDAWEKAALYTTDLAETGNKLYCLVMFIYPSGDRLHIGHWYNYGPTDSWARFKRMQGFTIFEPMGYDAFGLPAENYAIKKGVHPAESTAENITAIRKQLKAMGAMYDWSKEVNTSSPDYYKWTQWLFLLLYKNGLAYRKKAPVNWCPSCKTVLANEQVVDGCCERCDAEVIHRDLEQWFFKITDFADDLLEGLERIDWPDKTVTMQRNWIGRSEGARVVFPVDGHEEEIAVFTTRPDTLWGVTYMVLAPEHPLVDTLTAAEQRAAVDAYRQAAMKETEIDRTSTEKEKTGVFTGSYCINPVNGEKVPVWIADYVLVTYGTGAVMAVPGHDTRDFQFAKKFNLPILEVISPDGRSHAPLEEAFTDPGVMINSGDFTGTPPEKAIPSVIAHLEKNGRGGAQVNYKLRDWLVSRQRYWGAPIPIVHCDSCGTVPVPEDQLPVELPYEVEFTGSGESPLTTNRDWVATTCPACGEPARREVDTMDTFVCSSWYYLRFLSPDLADNPFSKELVNAWLPVDQYVGGAEHAVMHLMYARFITRVLHRLGLVNFDEPFKRLIHQGVITNNGAKMSKSRGNVINPDPIIERYGSDVFRMYLMFMGSYTEGGDWDDNGLQGMHRFLNRVWRLAESMLEEPPAGNENKEIEKVERQLHYAVKHASLDLEKFQFNTAIARIMELVNELYLYRQNVAAPEQNAELLSEALATLIQLIAPFAPHLGEELWQRTGREGSVFDSSWPRYSEEKLKTDTVTVAVQVNGKVRGTVDIAAGSPEETVKEAALAHENVQQHISGKTVKKVIVIKNKLVSIVVS
ncbi:leucine--tRNA ligase [bacterium]|nr:leucine--tRNA ligase [bacterium]